MQKDSTETAGVVGNLLQKITSGQPASVEVHTPSADTHAGVIGSLNTATCQEGKLTAATQTWSIPISTPLQKFTATVTIPAVDGPNKITVEVDGRKIFLAKSVVPSADLIEGICSAWRSDPATRTLNSDHRLQEIVAGWLTQLAPDCNFRNTSEQGWVCSLKTISAGDALSTISRMQNHMIQKWSRQSYTLTRKLAVSRTLAEAIKDGFTPTAQGRFCKVIGMSSEEELPVIFTSARWHQGVCGGEVDLDAKITLAKVGLDFAIAEQNFLHQLVEESSLLGLLQVKLPRAVIPNRDFWITLTPSTDVAESILSTSATIGKNDAGMAVGCWHPIYGADPKALGLAAHLKLLAPQLEASCVTSDQESHSAEAAGEYMANSILGETEFLIGNGNSKILRLPRGQYNYVIRGMPENSRQWHPSNSDIQSTGQISWIDRRPHPVITSW